MVIENHITVFYVSTYDFETKEGKRLEGTKVVWTDGVAGSSSTSKGLDIYSSTLPKDNWNSLKHDPVPGKFHAKMKFKKNKDGKAEIQLLELSALPPQQQENHEGQAA